MRGLSPPDPHLIPYYEYSIRFPRVCLHARILRALKISRFGQFEVRFGQCGWFAPPLKVSPYGYVCVGGKGGSLKFHSGNLLEQHPNCPNSLMIFEMSPYSGGASPPDPPFDIPLGIFNKKSSRRMPVCENYTRTQDRSIRAHWIVCKMSWALCAHLK